MNNNFSNKDYDIVADDLKKTYGNFDALQGVSLKIAKGEFYTLFGPNGAGKTTLIKLLATLTTPSSGTLIVSELDTRKEAKAIRTNMGVISHDTYLYENLTALENINFFAELYGLQDVESRARTVIDQVGLGSRLHDLVRTFSRGMKQRLTVARHVPLCMIHKSFFLMSHIQDSI